MTDSAASQIPGMFCTLCSYEALFGPCHVQTLNLAAMLAVAMCEAGRQEEGRRLLERALNDLTKHHGRHHPVRMRALAAWAVLLRRERNWQAALAVQRELIDCQSQALGPDHPESLAARNQLATMLGTMTGVLPA